MPLITAIHESLPYIDPEPTPEERAAAEALIAAERALVPDDPYHALLRPAHVPKFSALMQAELNRVSAVPRTKLAAIDMKRYEMQDLPEGPTDDETPEQHTAALRDALQRAYASHAYVSARRAHLALLDSYGKNAWLVGNWHLEAELKAIEADLASTKREIDLLTVKRQQIQNDAAGEMRGLEEAWRRGVGKVLETEVAAEQLRRQILEAMRAA